MSHFFGVIEGSTTAQDGTSRKTRATRGAGAKDGLTVVLRSNEGSLRVSVYEGDDDTGGLEDRVRIRFESVWPFRPNVVQGLTLPNQRKAGQDFTIYDGPLNECDFGSIYTNTQESEVGE